ATTSLMGRHSLRARRLGLALAFGNLLVLGVFKYYDLLSTTLNEFVGGIGVGPVSAVLHLALPLGISFYTFNLLSYSIDVYRRRRRPVFPTSFPTSASSRPSLRDP